MKLRSILTTGVLAGALVAPTAMLAGTAAAQSTTQVWATNAYTYGAGHPFDFTICLDGTLLASLSTTETSGPTTVESGDHEVEVHDGLNADCAEKPDFTRNVTIPEGAGATLALWWPGDSNGDITVFSEDMSCVPAGSGRVTYRNLATYGSSDGFDLSATSPGGSDLTLVSNVQQGNQGATTAPTGTYTGANATVNGSGDFVTNISPSALPISETTQQVVYTYGGGDGAIGGYTAQLPSTSCEAPPTSAAPTTSVAPSAVAAPAAKPVAATPTYTG